MKTRPVPRSAARAVPAAGAVIPYDYGAVFPLQGKPGNLVEDVINVSPDGVFVAVAIGYGFEEDRGRSLGVEPTREQRNDGWVVPGDITLGQIPAAALIEGVRVNPRFEAVVFQPAPPGERAPRGGAPRKLADQRVPLAFLEGPGEELLLQRLQPPADISFLFSIVDSASGRELQDAPTHNLASLGKSNGERPFRPLARPLSFLPRSTLRLQVVERSEGVRGDLFIVLYGYKILGAAACPEPVVRALRPAPALPAAPGGLPPARVIPFDYVAQFALSGRAGNFLDEEVHVNVEGGFVATALGYGLAVEDDQVPIADTERPGLVNMAQVKLRRLPVSALTDGFRIRPDLLRIAFRDNAQLAALPADLANRLLESLNRPDDVSFRYTIFDAGRGLELQNRPLHNVAGLGIANGDRPFKQLARPMTFLPRSTIRVGVEEVFGRGELFLVFQGYKLLGLPPAGGRS